MNKISQHYTSLKIAVLELRVLQAIHLKYSDFGNPSVSVVGLELSFIRCFKIAASISTGIELRDYSIVRMFKITEDTPERERERGWAKMEEEQGMYTLLKFIYTEVVFSPVSLNLLAEILTIIIVILTTIMLYFVCRNLSYTFLKSGLSLQICSFFQAFLR